jgi:hypothetical protein
MSEAFEKLYLDHENLKKANSTLGHELRNVSDSLFHMYKEKCNLKSQLQAAEERLKAAERVVDWTKTYLDGCYTQEHLRMVIAEYDALTKKKEPNE